MAGRRFGRLVAVKRSANDGAGQHRWECRCDCGSTAVIAARHLRNGASRSCGCINLEHPSRLRHGHARLGHKTPTYRIWKGVLSRCRDLNDPYYGGRGITVCGRWLVFENFLEDMGERPLNPPEWRGRRAYWSIERADNDGPYSPENCRWATQLEQIANQRHRVPA